MRIRLALAALLSLTVSLHLVAATKFNLPPLPTTNVTGPSGAAPT